jgi:hypothetical protein
LFRVLPEPFRLEVVRRHLGPAPGWFMREKVEGRLSCMTRTRITQTCGQGGRARLTVTQGDGSTRHLEPDHIIAATGYRIDLARLGFIGPALTARIRLTGSSPRLSAGFESTVPGLYFVGASAAESFGPMLRFAFGAGFAARRVTRSLTRAA